jgi:glucose-6-phosphate 1-dehydrogenase
LNLLHYVGGNYLEADTFARLKKALGSSACPIDYLAIPPNLFISVVGSLARSGCLKNARVIVEKPFGRDLDSAQQLNAALHAVLPESRIFRIDHYLGKEAVLNLLFFGFANSFLEPIWNRNYVCTIPPLDPKGLVRGQFNGYSNEDGVARDSKVETFAAVRLEIQSWRWSGVPFLIRAGKRLPVTTTEVLVKLRRPPLDSLAGNSSNCLVPAERTRRHATIRGNSPRRPKCETNKVFPRVRYEDYRRALCFLDPYGLHKWAVIEAGEMHSHRRKQY